MQYRKLFYLLYNALKLQSTPVLDAVTKGTNQSKKKKKGIHLIHNLTMFFPLFFANHCIYIS